MSDNNKKILIELHVITGLNNGGAESVLFRLCVNDSSSKHVVISLMDLGKYGSLLLDKGIDVYCLNMPQGKVTLKGLIKLYKLLKNLKPDIVQTWMYHADLIGGVVARLAGIKEVFWNIRQTSLEEGLVSTGTIYVAKLCSLLSYFIPKKIVCCAHKALEYHANFGYQKTKMVVIGNGYELDQLVVSSGQCKAVRAELLLSNDDIILGMVGRYDPAKDHSNLLLALSYLNKSNTNFKCLLVGKLLSQKNTILLEEISALGLTEHILLMEQRADIPAVMNALDVHILSSYSEAFPNVIAEAMACGTPCVTTNVGDAALIVGETGWVVPPRDPVALAASIQTAINERSNTVAWQARKLAGRQRIVENFSIEKMINSYKAVWSN